MKYIVPIILLVAVFFSCDAGLPGPAGADGVDGSTGLEFLSVMIAREHEEYMLNGYYKVIITDPFFTISEPYLYSVSLYVPGYHEIATGTGVWDQLNIGEGYAVVWDDYTSIGCTMIFYRIK